MRVSLARLLDELTTDSREAMERRLLRACVNGDLDLVRQLVKEGCNPRDVRDRDSYNETALHAASRYVLHAPSFPPSEVIKLYAQP